MSDLKKSGSRLVRSRIHVARIKHQCRNEYPECNDSTIFPGDLYERQVWVHFRSTKEEVTYRWEVKKYHVSPSCTPDPEFFEFEHAHVSEPYQLALAA